MFKNTTLHTSTCTCINWPVKCFIKYPKVKCKFVLRHEQCTIGKNTYKIENRFNIPYIMRNVHCWKIYILFERALETGDSLF
jgi:hypothetical protein